MRILKILVTVIVVLVLALVGLVFVLPGEKIAKIAADQVKAQTGRDLRFQGDVSFSFFPTLGVSTGPIALSNADWSNDGPMFQAEAAKIGVDLMGLIGGNIQVKDIVLTSPNILLEKDKDGHANWDLFPAASTSANTAPAEAGPEGETEASGGFTLDHLKVSDARVRYVDHAGAQFEVNRLDADLNWGSAGATIALAVTPVSDRVTADIEVGNLDTLIAGDITTLKTMIKGVGNTIAFDGRVSIVPEAAGKVDASLPNAGALMAALGLDAAEVPALDFAGDVTLTKEQLFSLRDGDITVLGNSLRADADVDLTGKPYITANIQAGALDFAALTGGEPVTNDAGPVNTAAGWSTDQIDASALGLVNGSIAISANSLNTGTLKFGASRLKIDIDNARAVADLQELHGYDGIVSGQFVMNNRSGLSVGGKMNFAGLELKELLTDFADIDRFTGLADAQVAFLGVGNSLDAIMKSLKGDGALSVGQGTIAGMDLDKLFRGTPSGGTTVFDALSASWTIENGTLQNDDLRMELPSVLAKGAGRVGLGAQTIDYTFTPQLRNDTETGIAVPVRIKGNWADPKIWPDLEAVVNQNFAKEKKELQEKAKNAVAEKLGVTRTEGQSVEDAVKQELENKLEDEVGNALKKLLGGG